MLMIISLVHVQSSKTEAKQCYRCSTVFNRPAIAPSPMFCDGFLMAFNDLCWFKHYLIGYAKAAAVDSNLYTTRSFPNRTVLEHLQLFLIVYNGLQIVYQPTGLPTIDYRLPTTDYRLSMQPSPIQMPLPPESEKNEETSFAAVLRVDGSARLRELFGSGSRGTARPGLGTRFFADLPARFRGA